MVTGHMVTRWARASSCVCVWAPATGCLMSGHWGLPCVGAPLSGVWTAHACCVYSVHMILELIVSIALQSHARPHPYPHVPGVTHASGSTSRFHSHAVPVVPIVSSVGVSGPVVPSVRAKRAAVHSVRSTTARTGAGRTATRKGASRGGATKGTTPRAGKAPKPPVDTVANTAAANAGVTRIYVVTTPVAQVHQYGALGYAPVAGVITVPTIVATQVAAMPAFPQ